MTEIIAGTIYLENSDGDIVREISAPPNETTTIEGILGTLIIDAQTKDPPQIQGKGVVFFLEENNTLIRTRRLKQGEKVTVVMSADKNDYREIGEIEHKANQIV